MYIAKIAQIWHLGALWGCASIEIHLPWNPRWRVGRLHPISNTYIVVTQPRIVWFCSNLVHSLITWHQICHRHSKSGGQRTRSQRKMLSDRQIVAFVYEIWVAESNGDVWILIERLEIVSAHVRYRFGAQNK